MFILGHTGITLGIAVIINDSLSRRNSDRQNTEDIADTEKQQVGNAISNRLVLSLLSLGGKTNILLLLVSSMLPDIIDKPLGHIVLANNLGNGRIFCHTLLFLVTVSLLGTLVHQFFKRTWLLTIAFGVMVHLILDRMWLDMHTFLWPLYQFPVYNQGFTSWTQEMASNLFTSPYIITTELIGGSILALFTYAAIKHRTLIVAFIRNRR